MKEALWVLLTIFTFLLLPIFITAGYHNSMFNYPNYYLFFICFIYLFTGKYRIFYLQVFFILTYYLSTISKIQSEAWTLGFINLPPIPVWLIPVGTNMIILLQLCVPILLLSDKKWIRLGSFFILEAFHLYTVSFIDLAFFCVTSPFLFFLFYYNYERPDLSNIFKSIPGFILIFIIVLFNFIRVIIPGNDYYTFEGAYLGFNMFQSYKACSYTYIDKDGEKKTFSLGYGNGNQSCDPYNVLMRVKDNCIDERERSLVHTIKFPNKTVELINVPNYCSIKYEPFKHNEWIAPKVIENRSSQTSFLSRVLEKNIDALLLFYKIIFVLVGLYLVGKIFKVNIFKN